MPRGSPRLQQTWFWKLMVLPKLRDPKALRPSTLQTDMKFFSLALIAMASTLQTTPAFDFETALAKFVANGSVNTQDALEEAVFDLLIAMQAVDCDVPSLLAAVSRKITG
ncbi:hypothetical protein M407DRAFT_213424, partial [Tulasnella calospora MUT 4182]